jgi:NAD(P)H-nitrite reductase large subunit
VRVNAKERSVTTSKSEDIKYDYLVLASGGKPRSLEVPGHDLANIFVLRSPEDANKIAEASQGKRVGMC